MTGIARASTRRKTTAPHHFFTTSRARPRQQLPEATRDDRIQAQHLVFPACHLGRFALIATSCLSSPLIFLLVRPPCRGRRTCDRSAPPRPAHARTSARKTASHALAGPDRHHPTGHAAARTRRPRHCRPAAARSPPAHLRQVTLYVNHQVRNPSLAGDRRMNGDAWRAMQARAAAAYLGRTHPSPPASQLLACDPSASAVTGRAGEAGSRRGRC